MGKWVYRRPYFRQARNKLPLTRGHGLLIAAFTRRRVAVRRRTWFRRRAAALGVAILGRGHNAHLPGLRRVFSRTRKRWRATRRVGFAFTKTAAAGAAPVIFRRQPQRRRTPIRRRAPALPGTFTPPTPANNKMAIIGRFRRAVARIREQMQRRLCWRPRPAEIVAEEVVEYVAQSSKGRILAAGMTRGRLSRG